MPTRDEIKEFSLMVEKLAAEKKMGLMDSICHYCKESGLEVEISATLISPALKAKIREEAESLNLIKKTSKLPI
jgi:hypothetical protein